MADITSQISTLSIKLTMYRASDESTKTRTFSVRDPAINEENPEPFRQSLQALQNFLLGDGKTLIQPTGWRDDDTTEDEYTTTAVEFTTEEGVGTKWDTRLTHNVSLNSASVAWSSISTVSSTPTAIDFSGVGMSGVEAYIDSRVTEAPDIDVGYLFSLLLVEDTAGSIGLVRSNDSISPIDEIKVVFPETGVYQKETVTLTIT